MKKCCANCIYQIEIKNNNGDFRLVKCWQDGRTHRRNKELRGCVYFKSKLISNK